LGVVLRKEIQQILQKKKKHFNLRFLQNLQHKMNEIALVLGNGLLIPRNVVCILSESSVFFYLYLALSILLTQ
jgi:hypothetical protein